MRRIREIVIGYRTVVREGDRYKIYVPRSIVDALDLAGKQVLVIIELEEEIIGGRRAPRSSGYQAPEVVGNA
jgi:adenylate kinase